MKPRFYYKIIGFVRRLTLILVWGAMSIPLYPQSGRMKFDHLNMDDGLSESIVLSIIQDTEGYMWFGTADGLNRYDGYSFTVFRHNAQDSLSLTHNYVQALHVDEVGTIWVGTIAGLDWYDREHKQFHRVPLVTAYREAKNEFPIQTIIEDASHHLWIGTGGGGIFELDVQYNNSPHPVVTILHHYTDDPNNPNDLPGMFASPQIFDSTGNVWISSLENGVSILNPTTGLFSRILHDPTNPQSLNSNRTRTILFDEQGALWIGTEDAGLNRTDVQSMEFKHYEYNSNGTGALTNNVIRRHYKDSKGRLWVATDGGGLLLYHPETDSFEAFRHDATQPASIASDRSISIYEDRSGTIWIGTWGAGVDRWSPVKDKFINAEPAQSIIKALPNKFVVSFFEDSKGIFWVGTHGGGALAYDPVTKTSKLYEEQQAKANTFLNGVVWSIREDSSGNIWFATDFGVSCLNRKQQSITRYDDTPTPGGALNSHYAGNVLPLHDVVWVSTEKGLNKINPQSWKVENFPYSLAGIDSTQGYICGFYVDEQELIWLGTTPITIFDTKKEEFISAPITIGKLPVSCIVKDSKKNIWVGTFGDGVFLFSPDYSLTGHFTMQDGLPNNLVYGVLEDKHGMYWMSTNHGIAKFDLETKTFRNYDVADGLQSNEFNRSAFYTSRNGMLYFGGINGFNAFYPDSIQDNPFVPPVVITGFRKFNEPVIFSTAFSFVKEIVLEYKENFFSFEFAALAFTDPLKNSYAYKLEGFDKDWVYCESRRFASYTNVNPGSYTFIVKASNNDGKWNEQGTSILVTITPPWWKTWWAYALYIIILGSGSLGIRWLVKNWKIIIASRKAQYISHYKLHEMLGEGGMGKVYRAVDTNTKHIIALKILNPALLNDEENRKRLLNEGRLLSSFAHPNIVKVFEVSESEEGAFIAMEYLSGGTLKDLLAQSSEMPLSKIKSIIFQICDGVSEIHNRGIIHRDIKSANIMFDENGIVRIMDFGLSKSPLVTTMTTLGTVIGTLGYVAPEQVTGLTVDQRVDIFSFGVLLYELLTKRLPFTGENEIAVIHSIFNTKPAPPSSINANIPKELDAIVLRCLAKNAAERYALIKDVKVELDKEFW